jgi:hypothetical protein
MNKNSNIKYVVDLNLSSITLCYHIENEPVLCYYYSYIKVKKDSKCKQYPILLVKTSKSDALIPDSNLYPIKKWNI